MKTWLQKQYPAEVAACEVRRRVQEFSGSRLRTKIWDTAVFGDDAEFGDEVHIAPCRGREYDIKKVFFVRLRLVLLTLDLT